MYSKSSNNLFADARSVALHGVLGFILGILFLHPLTTLVGFFEFNDSLTTPSDGIWDFWIVRSQSDLWFHLIPMNAVFGSIGAVFAIVIGAYSRAFDAQQRRTSGGG